MARLLIYCDGGFGNRYNALVSGLAAAEVLKCTPEIYWPINNWCEAEYLEMFGDGKARVHTENLIDLKDQAKSWLVLSHDLRNAEYLSVPFVSAYGFASETGFADYCKKDRRDIFFYPALVPPWLSRERLKKVAGKLRFQPDLVAAADAFIATGFSGEFYGIHLRRTDLVLGYTDSEAAEIASAHPDRQFFVCSDSADSERALAQLSNVRVREKQSYVERQEGEKGWTDVTLDTSKRAYYSNVRRNSQSVRDALVDLLILSRSTMVGKTASTFLNVASFIKELSGREAGTLPDINTIPIEESFRKVAAGVLDVMQAISAAQQLWAAQQYDQAVALLRLWLKQPDSPHAYVVFFNLAVYLEHMGSLNEAECYLRHTLHLQPQFLQGYLQLGLLLEKLKRKEEVTALWLHALSLPAEEDARNAGIRNTLVNNAVRLLKEISNS